MIEKKLIEIAIENDYELIDRNVLLGKQENISPISIILLNHKHQSILTQNLEYMDTLSIFFFFLLKILLYYKNNV